MDIHFSTLSVLSLSVHQITCLCLPHFNLGREESSNHVKCHRLSNIHQLQLNRHANKLHNDCNGGICGRAAQTEQSVFSGWQLATFHNANATDCDNMDATKASASTGVVRLSMQDMQDLVVPSDVVPSDGTKPLPFVKPICRI